MSRVIFPFICLFIVLGIVFCLGHGSNLVAGYNSLPREQQERYDTPAMCRFMGKIMFALAACMLVRALADPLAFTALLYIGTGAVLCRRHLCRRLCQHE